MTHSAGVITLIKKTITNHTQKHELPADIAGHLTHQTINNNAHIIGVYMPCNDTTKRNNLYTTINNIINNNPSHHYIILGDWNAAYFPNDKSNTTKHPEDSAHKQHLNNYHTKIQPSPRLHTYYTYTDNTPYRSSSTLHLVHR